MEHKVVKTKEIRRMHGREPDLGGGILLFHKCSHQKDFG
jgi:hypothetical protein